MFAQFAANLKALRLSRKLTQVNMAVFLDCTKQHYQRIEYGKIDLPTSKLMKLCEFFNVSADYMLGLSDKPEVNK